MTTGMWLGLLAVLLVLDTLATLRYSKQIKDHGTQFWGALRNTRSGMAAVVQGETKLVKESLSDVHFKLNGLVTRVEQVAQKVGVAVKTDVSRTETAASTVAAGAEAAKSDLVDAVHKT